MSRNGTLDYARLLAAVGIVWFHSGGPGSTIGYAALPFFTMLLVVLAFPSAQQTPFFEFARKRASRLLVPWFVWSAVYGTLKTCEVAVTGKPLSSEFHSWMLLTGPALHLWFLPFAYFLNLVLHPIARLLGDTREGWITFAVITLMTLFSIRLFQEPGSPIPLAQWLFVLPSAIFGVAYALAEGQNRRVLQVTAIAIVVIGLAMLLGWSGGVLQFALSSIAITLCLLLQLPETLASQMAARLSLSVYLGHPLVASILERLTPLKMETFFSALVTVAGALALAFGLDWLGNRQRQANRSSIA
jgi:peptidoglycan/LPS O-acetylase OafA/YrhL